MTPGPTLIMKAPGCKKPVKFSTIASGNTFGATFWTDGKQEAPMLPDKPWLRRSPSEGVLFWTDQCEEIGRIDFFHGGEEKNAEWKDLEYAEEPSEADYLAALSSGIADTDERKRYLRMRLWWTGNDCIRRGESQQLSASHVHNLEAFSSLLSDSDPDQRLMKAEVMRELSRYDEALSLLDFAYPDDYSHAVTRIRELATSGDAMVAKLK
jgi:hypothetical protein